MVFKRRRRRGDDDREPAGAAVEEPGSDPAATAPESAQARRPHGPWDVADAPADDTLIDLGGLRVPVVDGFDVTVTAEGDVPVLVAYQAADGLMQLHAFAAPKSAGIWEEVRREIAESLRGGGGAAQETPGPFGPELRATIPVQTPEGTTVMQPARFIGVDGPRWFLRALLAGPIVEQPARAEILESAIRRVVVVRGHEAMAPREVIPLRLPKEVLEAAAAEAEADPDERPRLTLPERGPEITEVR